MTKKLSKFWRGINLVVDTTWGDGGKGKFVDLGGQFSDIVIRYAGGDNAGHTVKNDLGEFKLHLIPSGIFNPETLCILGTGVVINPFNLVKEITELQKSGIKISPKNLLISDSAHLIMPWHAVRDGLGEKARGGAMIGTTGKGIGPTYSDRSAREGLRTGDLLDKDFEKKLRREFDWQNKLVKLMGGKALDYDEICTQVMDAREILSPMITNTLEVIWKAKEKGLNILGEGAQGALLDIDLGGYPYVTSSHPGLPGFSIATGIHQQDIRNVYGVTKAYSTRVGGGPMPTELFDEVSTHLQAVGKEIGTTTGRTRRCGWFDAMAVRYGATISGSTSLAITKLDVLDGLQEVKICKCYKVGDKKYKQLYSVDNDFMSKAEPIYETLKGWNSSTSSVKTFEDLPKNAQKYIQKIEEIVSLPVTFVSVGPDREETLAR